MGYVVLLKTQKHLGFNNIGSEMKRFEDDSHHLYFVDRKLEFDHPKNK